MSGKGFLGNMTENLQADCVQSRQAGFMQRFLNCSFSRPSESAFPAVLPADREFL